MSRVLYLWDEIGAICKAAGLEPNSVSNFWVTPEVIGFEVYMEPKQQGAYGPLTVIVTHPWTRDPE